MGDHSLVFGCLVRMV